MSHCDCVQPEAPPDTQIVTALLQHMFFFAHMNCHDCKKLLSCLAVLWKGVVLLLFARKWIPY